MILVTLSGPNRHRAKNLTRFTEDLPAPTCSLRFPALDGFAYSGHRRCLQIFKMDSVSKISKSNYIFQTNCRLIVERKSTANPVSRT